MSGKKARLKELLEKQEEDYSKLAREYLSLLSKAAHRPRVIRCKECRNKGNPFECRLDRDLEEHGSHRTDEWDDWYCADGKPKESEHDNI